MKEFTMSMYKNKEELYKAKAEYYEELFKRAKNHLCCASTSLGNLGAFESERKIDRFLESLDE